MTKPFTMLAAACLISILLPTMSQGAGLPATPPSPSKAATHTKAVTSEGERAFKQNCSRCHDAPQSLSPTITGTVIRHMRVRASLSEKDERAILKFMNP